MKFMDWYGKPKAFRTSGGEADSLIAAQTITLTNGQLPEAAYLPSR